VVLFKLPVKPSAHASAESQPVCPHFAIPHFRADLIHGLLGPALTVAMLGAIESLMSAVVSDRMSNDHHNPNVELIGQGVANVISPMYWRASRPGAIARTGNQFAPALQISVAGMIHRPHPALHLLFAAPLVGPRSARRARRILMVVAYNMASGARSRKLLKSPD